MSPEDLPDRFRDRLERYHAQRDDLKSVEEAHAEILTRGFDQISMSNTPSLSTGDASYAIGTPKPGFGLHSSLAHTRFPSRGTPVRSIVQRSTSLGESELEEVLAVLQEKTGNRKYPNVTASISQVGGEWYVGGAGEIYKQLTDIQSRWGSQPDWETHDREMVTVAAQVGDVSIYLGGQNSQSGQNGSAQLEWPWLSIVTDGYPTTGEQISEYADMLNFPTPQTAKQIEMPRTRISEPTGNDAPRLTIATDKIVEPVVYSEPPRQNDWVCGAVIENPFSRALLMRLLKNTSLDKEEVVDELLARDYLLAPMLDHHPHPDDKVIGYVVKRLRITDLGEATERRGGVRYNIELPLRYVEESSGLSKLF